MLTEIRFWRRGAGLAVLSVIFLLATPHPSPAETPEEDNQSEAVQLPEIEVKEKKEAPDDYHVPDAVTATKTDTPVIDTPVSIQVVPQEVIQDQQAIRLKDAVKNVSGVTEGFGYGNYLERFMIRGFLSNRSQYRDGFLNYDTNLSLANADRIEVLKGPASVLYGRLEPGGLINIVTRRPQREPYYSLQQQIGSFNTHRTTADLTGPLMKERALSYRLNFEYLNQDGFRDFDFDSTRRKFVAPSLTWRPGKGTRLDLDLVYQDEDTFLDGGIPAIGDRPAPIPITRIFGEPGLGPTSHTEYLWTAVTLSQEITNQWKARGRFQMQKGDGFYGGNFGVGDLDETTGILNRTFGFFPYDTAVYFGTVDLTGRFSTAGLDHTLLFGADYYIADYEEPNGLWLDGPFPINIFNPVYGTVDVNAIRSTPPNSFFAWKDKWYGVYVQDQIAVGERWHFLAGGRYDHAWKKQICCPPPGVTPDPETDIIETNDRKVTPRAGLLYHPVSWLGLYGSYVEGFNSANLGRDINGNPLEPELSRQYEAGLKAERADRRLSGSLALFDLTKKNIVTPVPGQPGVVDVTGEARNRGIELDVSGALSDDWRLIASYAYIDSEITKDRDEAGGPANQGHRLSNVPRHSGSLWTRYEFTTVGLPGLTAGGGVFLVGQRQGNDANNFQLPGYGRVDAALGYSRKVGPTRLTAQFNVENLFDKVYYVSSQGRNSIPGAPRTLLGSLRVEF